ncbi:dipeptidyl-peptidase IV [Clostridium beijerinckii]|uniref:dipeptidyl-peptidase IV n=1 Tax=Clostridium beijerinckii TaxID=1520 RepID=UPI002FEE2CD2
MKKLIVCMVLSLLLQVGSLYILNNFVFINSSEFSSKKIETKKDLTKDINITIPKDADNIYLSYEGRYLIYSKDKTLYIGETKTGKENQIKTENNEEIMCYKWLDNRDILAVVEKVKKNGSERIQLITYNAIDSSKTLVKEICKYEKNIEVKNITASILTGVYYIDINKNGSKSLVYRIDRNDDLKKVDINAGVLDNMQTMQHEDRLVYQDKITGKIFVTSPNKQLTFSSNKKLVLLGIDRNDVLYMGEVNGDKIATVIYGKVNENTFSWKKVAINSPVSRNDLYFSNKSEILINDNLKESVKNLTTGEEIEYEGKLIQMKEDFIVTMDGKGKLTYKNLKDK